MKGLGATLSVVVASAILLGGCSTLFPLASDGGVRRRHGLRRLGGGVLEASVRPV